MVDWIEELLSGMAAEEQDDEEQEDVLALTEAAVTASPREGRGEAGEADVETAVEKPAPVEVGDDRGGGRTAAEIALERPGAIAGETAEDSGETAERLREDELVWTVRSIEPGVEAVQKLAEAERLERVAEASKMAVVDGGGAVGTDRMTIGAGVGTEWAAREPAPGAAFEGTRRAAEKQAGLKGLYWQTVQGARPAAPALPSEQAGKAARAQEPGSAGSLAVDELDRAVRRDSRRYDGGMSIY